MCAWLEGEALRGLSVSGTLVQKEDILVDEAKGKLYVSKDCSENLNKRIGEEESAGYERTFATESL